MSHELEALIRTDGDGAYAQRAGDVVCVKLSHQAYWGLEELRHLQPVPWDDDDLKQKLENMLSNGAVDAVIPLPYKQIATGVMISNGNQGQVGPVEVIKTRSSKYFNIDSIQDQTLKNNIIDNEIIVPVENITDDILNLCVLQKTEVEINAEFEANKLRYLDIISKENPSFENPMIASKEKESLERYARQLKQYYNIDAKVVDGKISVYDKQPQGEI